MRIVKGETIVYFSLLLLIPSCACILFYLLTKSILVGYFDIFWLNWFSVGTAIITFYSVLLLVYRVYLKLMPFPMGELNVNSPGEARWKVYITFWLLFLYPLILPRWIPIPLTGVLYRVLGARIGRNSYFGGVIYDPHFVQIGDFVLGGAQSMIVPHITEGERLAHYPIRIGNNVTIGAGSIILPGVEIGDNVMIGAGAIVAKNTKIGSGEIWTGNPAKFLKRRQDLPSLARLDHSQRGV